MSSPEFSPRPESSPIPQPKKFSFLKKEGETSDIALEELEIDQDRQNTLRQINILAGTEKLSPDQNNYEQLKKESAKAERLLDQVVHAIHSKLNKEERSGNFAAPMAKFNNRLVSLLLGLPDNEISTQVNRIYKRLQRRFSEKYPKDATRFLEWSRGNDRGIVAVIKFIKERSIEQLPNNSTRKLFYNNNLDAKYSIDLVELNYRDDDELVVDDMQLIQIKSGVQKDSDNERIQRSHAEFTNHFMTGLNEFEKKFVPSIKFRDDDEQLAFNESLVELQSKIEIAGQSFSHGKLSKNQFINEVVAILEKPGQQRPISDFTSLNQLTPQEKMWFVETYINNLMQFIIDPDVERELKNIVALIHQEIVRTNYRPPKAAVINSIRSAIWAPGDPMPGSPNNPGIPLYSSKMAKSGQKPEQFDRPVIISH
jgi:hypothetical protein